MSDTQPPNEKNAAPLTIARQAAPGVTTLTVRGELDMTTYENFCEALMDEADRATRDALVLDLTGVAYSDARTWTLIVQARRQLTAQARLFTVLLTPGGQPARVHQLMRLSRVVPLT